MSTNDSFIKQWSTTPAANGTAPNVVPYGWPEGMPPSAVNDTARQQMTDHRYQWEDAQWFGWGDTVSKASGTTFKIASDVTSRYLVDRRAKIFTSSTLYATITAASYSAPDTTVTLEFDSSSDTLGASFTAVGLAILTPTNSSLPRNLTSTLKAKNFIIGGNFDTNPWQRSVSVAAAPNSTYVADRFAWYQGGTSGAVTMKKTADAPTVSQAGIFTQNCLHVDVTTADGAVAAGDFAGVGQYIEGYNYAQIAQKTITLSFWVKSTKTGVFCVSLRNSFPDRSYIAEYTVNTTDTWEFKTIVVPASPSAGTWDYTNGVGIQILWALMAGSTYQNTANAWQNGNYIATSNQVNALDNTANNFKIQLVQLEIGGTASTFEYEDFGEVLQRCERYFETSYPAGSYAGAASVGAPSGSPGFSSLTNATMNGVQQFNVRKRATPSATTIYSYVAGTAGNVSQDNNSDVAVSVVTSGDVGFDYQFTNGVGRWSGLFHYTAHAEAM